VHPFSNGSSVQRPPGGIKSSIVELVIPVEPWALSDNPYDDFNCWICNYLAACFKKLYMLQIYSWIINTVSPQGLKLNFVRTRLTGWLIHQAGVSFSHSQRYLLKGAIFLINFPRALINGVGGSLEMLKFEGACSELLNFGHVHLTPPNSVDCYHVNFSCDFGTARRQHTNTNE
jgi:hypothetical protein